MKRITLILAAVLASCGTANVRSFPCSIEDNEDGSYTLSCSNGTSVTVSNGKDGKDGESCSVSEPEAGTKLISCTDGTSVSVHDGEQGQTGYSCSVVDNGNGTSTVGCEDGTSATVKDGELCEVTPNGDGTNVIVSCPNDYIVEGSAIIEGDVDIRDSVTLALIKNYSRITGDLYIANITNISLPNLVEVGGALSISYSEIVETIDLPALVSVAKDPNGSGVTGLRIGGNTKLRSVNLNSLEEVGGADLPTMPLEVRIQDNPQLPSCWADALLAQITTVGDVYQSGNDDTATCD